MNAIIQRIHDAGLRAWLLFIQWLNGMAVTLLGGALVVHQSYPNLLGDVLGGVPGPLKVVALFAFGAVVHYALSRAKKAA